MLVQSAHFATFSKCFYCSLASLSFLIGLLFTSLNCVLRKISVKLWPFKTGLALKCTVQKIHFDEPVMHQIMKINALNQFINLLQKKHGGLISNFFASVLQSLGLRSFCIASVQKYQKHGYKLCINS